MAARDPDASTIVDDVASNQGEGAKEGVTVPAASAVVSGPIPSSTVAPTLSRSPDLSSLRGGGEGVDGNLAGGRQSSDRDRRELESAYRLIAQQTEMLEQIQRRLRELEAREHSREVRERPEEEQEWDHPRHTH